MITRKKRNVNGTAISSTLIVLLLIGVLVFLVFSNYKVNEKRSEMMERVESLKQEISELEKKNLEFKDKMFQASQESYWEEKIREQGYKKEGEQQVVVLPIEEDLNEKEEEMSFWDKFLRFFRRD